MTLDLPIREICIVKAIQWHDKSAEGATYTMD